MPTYDTTRRARTGTKTKHKTPRFPRIGKLIPQAPTRRPQRQAPTPKDHFDLEDHRVGSIGLHDKKPADITVRPGSEQWPSSAPAMLRRPKNSMVVPSPTQAEVDMIINGPGAQTRIAARAVAKQEVARLQAQRQARNFRLQDKSRKALPWLTRLGLDHLRCSNPQLAAETLRIVHGLCKARLTETGYQLPHPEVSLYLYREVECGGVILRDCVKKRKLSLLAFGHAPDKVLEQILALPQAMHYRILRILAYDIATHPHWGAGKGLENGHTTLLRIGQLLAR